MLWASQDLHVNPVNRLFEFTVVCKVHNNLIKCLLCTIPYWLNAEEASGGGKIPKTHLWSLRRSFLSVENDYSLNISIRLLSWFSTQDEIGFECEFVKWGNYSLEYSKRELLEEPRAPMLCSTCVVECHLMIYEYYIYKCYRMRTENKVTYNQIKWTD